MQHSGANIGYLLNNSQAITLKYHYYSFAVGCHYKDNIKIYSKEEKSFNNTMLLTDNDDDDDCN